MIRVCIAVYPYLVQFGPLRKLGYKIAPEKRTEPIR